MVWRPSVGLPGADSCANGHHRLFQDVGRYQLAIGDSFDQVTHADELPCRSRTRSAVVVTVGCTHIEYLPPRVHDGAVAVDECHTWMRVCCQGFALGYHACICRMSPLEMHGRTPRSPAQPLRPSAMPAAVPQRRCSASPHRPLHSPVPLPGGSRARSGQPRRPVTMHIDGDWRAI